VLPNVVSDYGRMLLLELGEPAQLDNAKKIAKRTGIKIVIEQNATMLSTDAKSYNHKVFEGNNFFEFEKQGLLYQLSFWHGQAMLRVVKPNEKITFVASFRYAPVKISLILLSFILSMVLVIFIAHLLVRYLIAPIRDIEQGIAEFSKGNLHFRIEKKRNDDLGNLTEHINQMAGQLNSILEAKRQLLLAISHELRTPMTRMKIALDLPFNEKNKSRFNDSLGHMEKLLSELLESEKLSSDHQLLDYQKVSINEIITGLLEQEYPEDTQIVTQLTPDNTES
jgi:signal transduction histidine kinase